ncbi:MAG: lipase family protein [Stenotrophobium sp.]
MIQGKQFCGCVASLALVLVLWGCSATSNNSALTAGGAADIPYAPTSDTDAFYQQPEPMPDVPSGTILNSRSITFAPQGVPLPDSAWQLQYLSHDANGAPIAAIATVVKPLIAALSSPAPLVSYQYAEDSLGSACAPSHSATGSTADDNNELEPFAYLTGLETQGWTLVIPDHEGPYSEYAAGKLAGQITLDGIRAAESFAPLGLSVKTPVGMWGYSGGAIATAWAASLQKSYAPELNIVGVASGGTPADVAGIVNNIDTNVIANAAFFPLILSAVEGVNRAYPQLATPILNAKGQAAFESLKDSCLGDLGSSTAPSGKLTDYTTTPDPLDSPGTKAVLPLITLPQPAPVVPVADVFVYHSQLDELVPIAGAAAMVKGWCAAGVHVSYYAGVTGDHIVFDVSAAPLALAYLVSRFNGLPTVTPPGTTTCN